MRQIASAHVGGQLLTLDVKTCSLRMSFTNNLFDFNSWLDNLSRHERWICTVSMV